jgi:hypothetical protein
MWWENCDCHQNTLLNNIRDPIPEGSEEPPFFSLSINFGTTERRDVFSKTWKFQSLWN